MKKQSQWPIFKSSAVVEAIDMAQPMMANPSNADFPCQGISILLPELV